MSVNHLVATFCKVSSTINPLLKWTVQTIQQRWFQSCLWDHQCCSSHFCWTLCPDLCRSHPAIGAHTTLIGLPQTPLPSMGLAALLTVSWLNFTSHSRIQALPLYHCICPVLLIQLVPELQVKQWKCLSFVQPFFFGIWLRLRWVSPLPRGVLTRTPGPTKPWSCRWWRHRAKPTKWPVTLAAQHHNMSSFRNSNVHQNLRDIELEIWCKLINSILKGLRRIIPNCFDKKIKSNQGKAWNNIIICLAFSTTNAFGFKSYLGSFLAPPLTNQGILGTICGRHLRVVSAIIWSW